MYIENNVTISHDPLPDVRADATQLFQVSQNLIINGIKYHGEETPKIHISAEKKQANGYFQCMITELELLRNILKEFLKFLKDCIKGKNILEQE